MKTISKFARSAALCLIAAAGLPRVLSADERPSAAASLPVAIWPEGKMPGNGAREPEAEIVRGDGFHRFTNISRPTLTLFPAAKSGWEFRPREAGDNAL